MSKTQALFEAVYDAPDDDEPRRRLAEHLLAEGDPRGQLIAWQLANVEEKKAKALLREHAAAWLAPLEGALVKASVRWERGFPVAGHLAWKRTAPERDAIVGVRALATLRSLDLEAGNVILPLEHVERLVFGGRTRGLRRLTGFPRALLPRLLREKEPFAIEELAVALEGGGGPAGEVRELDEAKRIAEAFADGRGLPRLRALSLSFAHRLGTDPETFSWLWSTKLGRRIERLRNSSGEHVLLAWLDALAAHGDALALRELVLFGRNDYVLHRTAQGFTRLTGKLGAKIFPAERANVEKVLTALEARIAVEVEGR